MNAFDTHAPVDIHELFAEAIQRDSEDLGGLFRLVDFIASPQFMVGTIVGAWFTVAAAFVVAFV